MIRVYIKTRFPNRDVTDQYDAKNITQTFHVTCEDRIAIVTFSQSYIDDHSPADILKSLMGYRLDRYIGNSNINRMTVTNEGIDVVLDSI